MIVLVMTHFVQKMQLADATISKSRYSDVARHSFPSAPALRAKTHVPRLGAEQPLLSL